MFLLPNINLLYETMNSWSIGVYRRCSIGHIQWQCVPSLHWCRRAFICGLCLLQLLYGFYHCLLWFVLLLPICSSFVLFWLSLLEHLFFCDSTSSSNIYIHYSHVYNDYVNISYHFSINELDAFFLSNILCISVKLGQFVILCPLTIDMAWIWTILLNLLNLNGSFNVVTLALGSWPRQVFAKVWAKNEAWESHFMFPRM